MRQIILDTETTGLEPREGHRIIEIGCVEMIDRRLSGNNFHQYLQPDREIDAGAIEVHGITNEFLADKPRFADIVEDFIDYIRGAELVIHNAPFDVGFLDHEFGLCGIDRRVTDLCSVLDSLTMARKLHPGQKNSLDALCRRYDIDNTHRELHGALLDAEILADVYLAMTGGQVALSLGSGEGEQDSAGGPQAIRRLAPDRPRLRVIRADEAECAAHRERLAAIAAANGGSTVWERLEGERDGRSA
ncbi:MAG TPA: DNA polymerase III subunit epsilon [Gammaproteobacteria bacterium]|nr:DNA polymerase III subunit epsilon [Gammaproteobacteria bacterium]